MDIYFVQFQFDFVHGQNTNPSRTPNLFTADMPVFSIKKGHDRKEFVHFLLTVMSSGFISWNDEDSNNLNEVQGTVPSGVYDQDTRIDYCCMTDGDVSQPISLPTQNPFYLFPYNSEQCQAVQGMNATEEYFRWDEENDPSSIQNKSGGTHPYLTVSTLYGDSDNNVVHYCYE